MRKHIIVVVIGLVSACTTSDEAPTLTGVVTQDLQPAYADLGLDGLQTFETFTPNGSFWFDLDEEGKYTVTASIDHGDLGKQLIRRDVFVEGHTEVSIDIPRPLRADIAFESNQWVLTWSAEYSDLTIDVYRQQGPVTSPWELIRQVSPFSSTTTFMEDGSLTELVSYRLRAWGTRADGSVDVWSVVLL